MPTAQLLRHVKVPNGTFLKIGNNEIWCRAIGLPGVKQGEIDASGVSTMEWEQKDLDGLKKVTNPTIVVPLDQVSKCPFEGNKQIEICMPELTPVKIWSKYMGFEKSNLESKSEVLFEVEFLATNTDTTGAEAGPDFSAITGTPAGVPGA